MRTAIRKFARWIGWSTTYHVAGTYTMEAHTGWSTISLVLTVRPWINEETYREVVEYVKSKAINPTTTPTITSITKLGL